MFLLPELRRYEALFFFREKLKLDIILSVANRGNSVTVISINAVAELNSMSQYGNTQKQKKASLGDNAKDFRSKNKDFFDYLFNPLFNADFD